VDLADRLDRAARGRRQSAGGETLREWLAGTAPAWYDWDAPHLVAIQAALERVTRGETRRLMVFLPPRHGKSELVTIRYPIRRLEREPGLRALIAAHTQALAEEFSRAGRRLARERLALSPERAAAADWQTTAGGGVRAVGVGTGVAGRGAGLIVIDDPVPGHEEAQSERQRERVWEWYRNDLFTRGEPGCPVLLIQTRWHEEDLAGRLLRSEDGPDWEVLRLPALAETQEERDAWAARHGRPAGAPEPLGREPGEALWPERFGREALAERERVLGPAGFAALFQQSPYPPGGTLFRREWFRVLPTAPPGRSVRFWDCASKAGPRNSYTAGALLGQGADGQWHLRHMLRGRWTYPDAKRVILETAAADGREVPIGIEDTANGTAILQDLLRDPEGAKYRLVPVRPRGDKATRAGAWASQAQGGNFHLTAGAWVEGFLDEATAFPHGAHSDQVDAVSGAFELLLKEGPRGPGIKVLWGPQRPRLWA